MKYFERDSKKVTRHTAVIAVWAAVVAAGHLLPTFPIWGTGGTFSVSSILNPLSGIFFGPLAGALSSAIGGFIGSMIAPHTAWMGPATFIVGTTTAFVTGCISWGNWPPVAINKNGSFTFNGGIIVYIIGTILWFTQEIGRNVFFFPVVFYGLGLIVMILGLIFAKKFFASSKQRLKRTVQTGFAIWLCAFAGLVGGASIGNFFGLVLFRLPVELWSVLMITAPIERALFALGAVFVGTPLMTGLRQIGIPIGPQAE
ncbi:MAG: ECF transporter S component [Treponema sp.]|nr:ECF transporter S component [Treponema sp.]